MCIMILFVEQEIILARRSKIPNSSPTQVYLFNSVNFCLELNCLDVDVEKVSERVQDALLVTEQRAY